MMQEIEIWLPVAGYEGYYEISSYGNFRSKDRSIFNPGLNRFNKIKSVNFTLQICRRGYHCVKLSKDGIKYHPVIHRLVAIAFIPNPENKPEVNHIDGNKLNNHYSNLEWVTTKENIIHKHKLGLANPPKGSKNKFAKLTEIDVLKIRQRGKYSTFSIIAKDNNLSVTAIANILKRKTWKHI